MESLTIGERFAMMALNSKGSNYRTTEKNSVLVALVVADYLDNHYDKESQKYQVDRSDIRKHVKKTRFKKLEKQIVDSLKEKGLIDEIKSLLACDLFYDKNIKLLEYISDKRSYEMEINILKAEFLEEGLISDESIILMWLLKESLCIYDLFSAIEIQEIELRMQNLSYEHSLVHTLMSMDFQSIWRTFVKEFLRMKARFAATGIGRGINYIYPVLQKDQSIFIDTKEFMPNAEKRLCDVIERVASQGHTCEVLRAGSVPVVRIDNVSYELIPDAVLVKIPIHGVRLRRYY